MLPKNAMPSAPPSSAHLGDAGGGARPLRRRGADDDVVGQREERRSEERQHERRDREQYEPADAGAHGGEQEIPMRPFVLTPFVPLPLLSSPPVPLSLRERGNEWPVSFRMFP